MLAGVRARTDEVERALPGDDIVPRAAVVMDRGFTVEATPTVVWPWLMQLGKRRAGWYLPRSVERLVPPPRRASQVLRREFLDLDVGQVIPDYGGREATFEVAEISAPHTLVYRSRRGATSLSWAIVLTEAPSSEPDGSDPATTPHTRVHLRLRLGPVRHRRLALVVGGLFDALTVAGMAAGLRERIAETHPHP